MQNIAIKGTLNAIKGTWLKGRRYMSTEEDEAQHLRLQVQYEKTRELVSSWLGDSDSDSEPEALPRQLNGSSGLGAASAKTAPTSAAFEKLKKQQKKRGETKGARQVPKQAPPPTSVATSDSDSDEVSRASLSKRSVGKSAFDMHKKKQKKK